MYGLFMWILPCEHQKTLRPTYIVFHVVSNSMIYVLHHRYNQQLNLELIKKGNPVHWSSRIRRVREGVPPLGVLYATLPCFYTRGCFQDLNPWPYGHMTTTLPVAPKLPLNGRLIKKDNQLGRHLFSQFNILQSNHVY